MNDNIHINKAHILVVDDEKIVCLTFRKLLEDENHTVSTASNIKEALTCMDKEHFDLVFLDINLGRDSGLDLLKTIKTREPFCPVILITGSPDIDTATEALRIGAFDYICKPVEQVDLTRVIKMALNHRALEEENSRIRVNLEAIFRSVKDSIITVDRNFKVIDVNDSITESSCGIDHTSIGQDLRKIKLDCDTQCIESLQKTLETSEICEIENIYCGGGTANDKIISLTTTPLKDKSGQFIGAVMVIRDQTRLVHLERDLRARRKFHGMIGGSKKMQIIYNTIESIKDLPVTVLVTGESGTGKELVVEALHHMGNRCNKPFIKVNCASLPENLLESELFGHMKGSFTGAIRDQPGRFERADGGTIFLDEIGDISAALQVRLLRVLQEREIERVGGQKSIKVDVRIVAATNVNLLEKVKEGKFREDLYYRLKVVEITVPPLREKREDILNLCDFFLDKFKKNYKKNITSLNKDVKALLLRNNWPGNVRQLENALESAFVLCRGNIIKLNDLPQDLIKADASDQSMSSSPLIVDKDTSKTSPTDEKTLILNALKKAGNNKAKAARILKIDRSTLYRKIDRYNLKVA